MSEILNTEKIGHKIVRATASFTRPANAVPYTAGDVVTNSTSATTLMKFGSAASDNGGSGWIVGAIFETDLKTSAVAYKLVLYDANEAVVTIPVDNAPDTSLWADRSHYIGSITFPAAAEAADTTNSTSAIAEYLPSGQSKPFQCATTDTALYGKLVDTTGADTPASAQNFSVTLLIQQN